MSGLTLQFSDNRTRRCGECQLCCKLLPMKEYDKKSGERCQHQRFGKGCAIYGNHPPSCQIWSCRWLVNNDTADLRRPDRSHYVIDLMPDYVETEIDGEHFTIEVVQVWCDPHHREAWRDPALLAYLDRRGKEGILGLIRWSSWEGQTIFPPSMSSDGRWHEVASQSMGREHTAQEKIERLGRAARGVTWSG